jgi:hypothetical protein
LRVGAVALPLLFVARLLGDPSEALLNQPVPPPHSVDVWGQHTDGLDFDLVGARAALDAQLRRGPPVLQDKATDPSGGTGPFILVGSVAVTAADEAIVTRMDTGFGIMANNLAELSRRFIQTFGDNYDQLAVFLAFPDRLSPAALAYQQPVKNDVVGIGLGLFDRTKEFGSVKDMEHPAGGRMQTVLNMKRISLYGRDAAGDPDNGLYPVWAQEAAHRWLVYYRFKRTPDEMLNDTLLGRQKAHWARGVEAGGSIMDGYDWKENPDGTFTPGRRGFQYGILDQYGMGLRKADEVPPFFLLSDIKDDNGNEPTVVAAGGRYHATKTVITVQDIIRGSGPRTPIEDAAAADLRMGVVLLGAPGADIGQAIGEAFQIDNTRRLWTEFYNVAGGGRGKVCTELLRPCREDAYTFTEINLKEAMAGADQDGVVAPGEQFALEVVVTNVGAKPGRPELTGNGAELAFDGKVAARTMLAPGESTKVTLTGRVKMVDCAAPTTIDLRTSGSRGGSRALADVAIGVRPKQVEGFDGAASPEGWRVSPQGSDDSGQAGRWAWGTPERSIAFDYTLQPGAAFSGTGAFVTGLSAQQTDNVEGRTTLESPPFSVGGLHRPLLSYAVYFVAADFAQEVLVPAPAGVLRTLASVDGTNWTEVDRLTGMATGWQRRLIRLEDKLGDAFKAASTVRLRFVAEENTQATRPVVEVALDEVGIYEESATCGQILPDPTPPAPPADDGGCAVGGRPAGSVLPLGVLATALLLARRRTGRAGCGSAGARRS